MVSGRKCLRLEEVIDFALNSNNSDCDTSVGNLYGDKEDDLDCQLEGNDNLKDLR